MWNDPEKIGVAALNSNFLSTCDFEMQRLYYPWNLDKMTKVFIVKDKPYKRTEMELFSNGFGIKISSKVQITWKSTYCNLTRNWIFLINVIKTSSDSVFLAQTSGSTFEKLCFWFKMFKIF